MITEINPNKQKINCFVFKLLERALTLQPTNFLRDGFANNHLSHPEFPDPLDKQKLKRIAENLESQKFFEVYLDNKLCRQIQQIIAD